MCTNNRTIFLCSNPSLLSLSACECITAAVKIVTPGSVTKYLTALTQPDWNWLLPSSAFLFFIDPFVNTPGKSKIKKNARTISATD